VEAHLFATSLSAVTIIGQDDDGKAQTKQRGARAGGKGARGAGRA